MKHVTKVTVAEATARLCAAAIIARSRPVLSTGFLLLALFSARPAPFVFNRFAFVPADHIARHTLNPRAILPTPHPHLHCPNHVQSRSYPHPLA